MKTFLFFLPAVCAMLAGCSKTSEARNEQPAGGGRLSSFEVTVNERTPARAIIQWTPSQDISNGDTVKYAVYLNGRKVDSNRVRTIDTLYNLSKDTLYYGTVLASVKRGDTASANFVLEAYNGSIFLFNKDDNKFGAYSSYTNGISNPRFWSYPLRDLTGYPTLSNDSLFFNQPGVSGSALFALNSSTGALLWSRSMNFYAGGVTYADGRLITSGGQVSLLRSTDGSLLWRTQLASNDYSSTPVAANGKIFVGDRSSSGHLSAFEMAGGNRLWDVSFPGQMCSRPLVVNNLVIFTTANAVVYALDQTTGNTVWTRNLSVTYSNYGANWVSPSLFQNKVIVHTANAGFYALDVLTGATRWLFPNYDPGASSPAFGNGAFYFTTTITTNNNSYRAKIVAVDATTGQERWEKLSDKEYLSDLVYAKKKLYLREYYNIEMVDAETGLLQGHILNTSSDPSGYAVRVNNDVYYPCEHGNFKAE